MKKIGNMKLDRTYIPYILMVLPSLASIAYSSTLTSNLEEYFPAFSSQSYRNYTRGKRQLFREDIPHHRPLSGNTYANEHGFPHPGRWADGRKNQHKPRPFVFPSHQQYLDMIDNNQHGNYHNRRPKVIQHPHSVSFGSNMLHGTSGGNYGLPHKPSFGYGGPTSYFSQGSGPTSHSESSGPGFGSRPDYGPGPSKSPVYGPPQPPDIKGPKTVVHYHPIQYGNVLNFPESGSDNNNNINSNYNPTPSYGPPHHSSGEPIGPIIESGGFRPSKPFLGSGGGYHQHNQDHDEDHHNDHKDSHYRFEPFKIFSNPPHKPEDDHDDLPIPIPILAQFHSAKPIKFTKIKDPFHHGYGHHGPRPRPGPRRPYPFPQQYSSRPYKHWLHQFGL